MKRIIYLLLITAIFGVAAYSQNVKPNAAALPAGSANWSGEHSDKLLKDPVIKTRLKRMLGAKNYASFMDSFETVTPITRDGDILFASGCLIHACRHLESAIAIDLENNTIHAAIFDEEKPTGFFNERGSKTPGSIIDWANHLHDLKRPAASVPNK